LFSGIIEPGVCFTGRGRKVGILLLLASGASLVGLVLLVPYPSELVQAVRVGQCFDEDEEHACFYPIFAGCSAAWRVRDQACSSTAAF
jgi:hypothetical protein